MAEDDDQPATKGDFRKLGEELRAEFRTELRTELASTERRIILELSGVIQNALGMNREDFQKGVAVVDETYQDLPARVTRLEHDVDELKRRPPPTGPRTRRTAKK